MGDEWGQDCRTMNSSLFRQKTTEGNSLAGCLYKQPANNQPIRRREFPASIEHSPTLESSTIYTQNITQPSLGTCLALKYSFSDMQNQGQSRSSSHDRTDFAYENFPSNRKENQMRNCYLIFHWYLSAHVTVIYV